MSEASAPAQASGPDSSAGSSAETEILQAIADGKDSLALSLCVQHHAVTLGRLCMSLLGSQTDADDVLQETLIAAHESLSRLEGRGSVRAWLCGIARNKCLKHLEKGRRRGARLRLVAPGEVPPSADEMLGARQRARQARSLLEQVRPSDRDALVLRYCCELTFGEVAEVCGIAEPAARKRVSRALLRLRDVAEKGNRDE
jgi:RNA polymerase sigma-70 factor (ECF subfamily)